MMRKWLVPVWIGLACLTACHEVDDPPEPDNSVDFSACVYGSEEDCLEVVSFNVEGFPLNGYETVEIMADLIDQMDADLIAFQEVASESYFDKLCDLLSGYKGIYYPIDNDDWNLAYLYKTSEISIDANETKILFEDDWYAFPRPPFEIRFSHASTGLSVVVINNHLKCCSGSDNEARRRDASEQLYAYALSTYPDLPVIILGDLNDEITGDTESENVFWSFVSDPDNFLFADEEIANGSSIWWSYPSYPSHIDHIIVSDELYSRVDTTMVFKPDACYSGYSEMISDHRPVFLRLR